MAGSVRDVMTRDPVTVAAGRTVAEAARLLRDADTGVLVVVEERDGDGARGAVRGVLTDRDVAVRAVAAGLDPATTTVGQVASTDVETVEADAGLGEVVQAMRSRGVRRVPVVDGGRLVGLVSLADLALQVDPAAPA